MEDYEADLDVAARRRDGDRGADVARARRAAHAITTAIVALVFIGGGAYVGTLSQAEPRTASTPTSRTACWSTTPTRGSCAARSRRSAPTCCTASAPSSRSTAIFGFLEHGPDSTGVTEHHDDQPGADLRPRGNRAGAVGEVLMRARDILTAAVALVAASSGCDWREFDSLQNATPVLAVGAPSELPVGRATSPSC